MKKEKSSWRQNIESLALALLIALAVRSSVVQAFWVPSGSMLPTIQIGDHIFVNKLAYTVRLPLIGTPVTNIDLPERGDIVVFVHPRDRKTDLIKRVIAVQGNTVEIRNKKLYVNDEIVEDTHAHFTDSVTFNRQRDNLPKQTVPEGKFFVLGDNRDRSMDSRYWGFAEISDIKGRATFVYWSRDSESCGQALRRAGFRALASSDCLPRWDRLGHYIR
jgi:signal peptidase I